MGNQDVSMVENEAAVVCSSPYQVSAPFVDNSKHGQKKRMKTDPDFCIYTIGHSTRPIEEFIALLTAHGVQRLVDVRTVPRSRHNPQFNRDSLPDSLATQGIHY